MTAKGRKPAVAKGRASPVTGDFRLHRHQPTPLNLGRYSALAIRTREVKA